MVSEATRAKAQGKLITVRTADLDYGSIPPPFDVLHTDVVDAGRVEAAIAKLASEGGTSGPQRDIRTNAEFYSDNSVLITSDTIVAKGQFYPISAVSGIVIKYKIEVIVSFWAFLLSAFEIIVLLRAGNFPNRPDEVIWIIITIIAWVWLLIPTKKYKIIAHLNTGRSILLLDKVTAQAANAISNAFSQAKIRSL